jgi:Short C-terminal domain
MGLMGRRRRRPLARMAVGAATAGVAYHAGKRRSEQDQYNEQASEAYDAQQQQQAPPAEYVPPAPAPSGGSDVDQLSKLAELHSSGALSDEEFAAAKSKVLGT